MQLNFVAPLETTRALADQMAERGHGSVIHMSSIAVDGGFHLMARWVDDIS